MASRKCEQCGATVAADEQFCPNCGNFMDPLTPEHRPHIISVSSSGFEEFDLSEPPQSPAPIASERSRPRQGNTTQCPSCGAINPSNNRHCEECGARLSQAPLPTAPRPAVQTTAGVRAALAISGLLFAVVIIALLFNVFTGDGGPTTTTTSAESTSTSPTIEENGPLAVIDTTCSVEPVGSFSCANLTSGSDAQYQANWEDLPDGEKIVIRLTFGQPMVVQQIQWKGVTDPVKFAQNYRPRGLVLTSSDAISDISFELSDDPGLQTIPFAAIGANWIEIEIQSAYFAELTEGNVFKEIAIDEITAIGRPQAQSTTSSSTTSTTTP